MLGYSLFSLCVIAFLTECNKAEHESYNRRTMWDRQAKQDLEFKKARSGGRPKKVGKIALKGDTIWEYEIVEARQ
jgi:hypothetical protein